MATSKASLKERKLIVPIAFGRGVQLAAVLAAVYFVAAGFYWPRTFFPSFYASFLFWLALPVGSLLWLMMHDLVGGRWGDRLRPIMLAAARTAIVLLPFAVVLWWGSGLIFPQLDSPEKPWYFASSFMLTRFIAYILIWVGLALTLGWTPAKKKKTSALGCILFALVTTGAAFDWIVGLESKWNSSTYGALFTVQLGLGAFSIFILAEIALRRRRVLNVGVRDTTERDIANLLLVWVLMWIYLFYTQYLIIWLGNKRSEVSWFLNRSSILALCFIGVAIFCQFVLPFSLLLFRALKNRPRVMGVIALSALLGFWCQVMWTTRPTYVPGLTLYWDDLGAWLGVGAWVIVLFVRGLQKYADAGLFEHGPVLEEGDD